MPEDTVHPPTLAEVMAFELDESGAPFTFTQRLAKENIWPLTFAVRVADEYKKFMFLAAAAGHAVSPSPIVDQAWHLHLAYTRSYWDDLCEKILHRKIHHIPTTGRADESAKFGGWYENTLASYRTLIGAEPPGDIWPDDKNKPVNAPDFRWIDIRRHWIFPKPWI